MTEISEIDLQFSEIRFSIVLVLGTLSIFGNICKHSKKLTNTLRIILYILHNNFFFIIVSVRKVKGIERLDLNCFDQLQCIFSTDVGNRWKVLIDFHAVVEEFCTIEKLLHV